MNVFLINNNIIQTIIAQEAKYKFGIRDEDSILIMRMNTSQRTPEFEAEIRNKILTYSTWKEIHFINHDYVNGFLTYVKNFRSYISFAEKMIDKFQPVENIFLGNYASESMRHVGHKYVKKGINIVFLDEGLSTFYLYNSRENNRKFKFDKSLKDALKANAGRLLKELVLNFKVGHIKEKISFFTEYPLKSTNKTNIVRNNFELLKKSAHNWRKDNAIYLLGQPFIKGLITKPDYYDCIRFVISFYKGKEVYYLPHPKEDTIEVEQIADLFNLKILRPKLPFELHLITNKVLPIEICGFTSTALSSSYRMFGDSCKYKSFVVPDRMIIMQKTEAFDNLYDFFRKDMDEKLFGLIEIK